MMNDPSKFPVPPQVTTNLMDRLNVALQLQKYKDIIFKRWWILFLGLSIGVGYQAFKVYNMPNIYAASGSMMVSPVLPAGATVGEKPTEVSTTLANFFGTQIQMMQSREVLNSVSQRMQKEAVSKDLAQAPMVALNIYPRKDANVLQIEVTSTSPDYAKKYLEFLMEEFIAYKKRIRAEVSEQTVVTLTREVERLGTEYNDQMAEVRKFEAENNIAYFEEQGNTAAAYLIDLSRKKADMERELAVLEAETAEQTLRRTGSAIQEPEAPAPAPAPSPAPANPGSPASTNAVAGAAPGSHSMHEGLVKNEYDKVQQEIALLHAEKDDFSRTMKPKHPKIVAITERIGRLEKILQLSLKRTGEEIQARKNFLKIQLEELKDDIRDFDARSLEANRKRAEYGALKAKAARTKELYDVVYNQLRQIDIGTSLDQEIIRVMETPTATTEPISPNRPKAVATGALIGIGAALAIILLLEKFDDRVKTVEELQEALQEPVLGQIPCVREHKKDDGPPLNIFDLPTQDNFPEAFRNVRSSIMFSPNGKAAQILLVTSAIPGDGKTTFAVNLAVCMAQAGQQTLLIDGDMRRMTINDYFKMEKGPGLSDVLAGHATFEESVAAIRTEKLHYLRGGTVPPNPGELILGGRLQELLEQLRGQYHRVIIDSPPVLATDDTLSLCPYVDGVLFVVKAGHTSMRYARNSMAALHQRGARIFGVILNFIDTRSAHYYYNYYYSGYYYSQKPG